VASKSFTIVCLQCRDRILTVPHLTTLVLAVLRGHLAICDDRQLSRHHPALGDTRGQFQVMPVFESARDGLRLILGPLGTPPGPGTTERDSELGEERQAGGPPPSPGAA